MTLTQRAAYTMEETAHRLGGVSRAHLYNLIARGELVVVKVGRRTLVPATEIDRLTTPTPVEGSDSE